MNFIMPSQILEVQNELKEYRDLCTANRFKPSKEEFNDIVKFILLYQGGTTTLCESTSTLDYLYENFYETLNEKGGGDDVDGTLAFDYLLKNTAQLAGMVAGGAASAASSIGQYISYLFKRGRIAKQVSKEEKEANKILDFAIQIYKLKLQKSELEGSDTPPKANFPAYPSNI
jgi:hypothetical protein